MGDNSVKSCQIKIPKPHARPHIRRRKSTKFHVNPMKDVEVSKTISLVRKLRRQGLSYVAKFKSAWAITPSKIIESKFQNHMHILIS